jgi:hypothetical protein
MPVAAWLALALLVALSVFQVGLALGAPWGAAAYGGRYPGVLPAGLRAISLVIVGGYIVGILAILGRLGIGPAAALPAGLLTAFFWFLTVMLALNTLANLASRSRVERLLMTPTAAVLAVCFAALALSG